METIPRIKIVVAGDLGTGKSSLINFFIRSLYSEEFDPELEDTYCKQVTFDDKLYNLEILDTVDNEFRSEHDKISMYQDCDAIILTYAVDDATSLDNIFVRYSNLPINEEVGENKLVYKDSRIRRFPPIILAGLKSDLVSTKQIDYHTGQRIAKDLKLQGFFECSAASNINVDELFKFATECGLKHQQNDIDLTNIYAAEEESQGRGSDRKHSTCTTISGNLEPTYIRKTKLSKNVQEVDPVVEVDIHKDDLQSNLIVKTSSVVSKKPTRRSAKQNGRSKTLSSDAVSRCCTIM